MLLLVVVYTVVDIVEGENIFVDMAIKDMVLDMDVGDYREDDFHK